MAIAYYIPDQSKLAEQAKPKPIKSIKIPLNHYTLSDTACWELIAQVFCYALRYHHLSAGNGILQITIEFAQQQPNPSEPTKTDNCGQQSNN